MSTHWFVIALGLGAAALAVWIDARFPRLVPSDQMIALLHVLTAIGVASFLVRPALVGAVSVHPFPLRVVAVLTVCLSALVYAFLTGVWLIKLTHALVARFLR